MHKAYPLSETQSGFTLIEIVVYVAILGVVLFFVSGFIFNGAVSTSRIEDWQEVNDTGKFITTQILDAVQSSQGINGVQ